MIRIYDKGLVELEDGSALNRVDIYCDSGDDKPTNGIVNGSTLTEVDTGKTYLFDESGSSWTEVSTGGGGGSGSGGFPAMHTISSNGHVYGLYIENVSQYISGVGVLEEYEDGFIGVIPTFFETSVIFTNVNLSEWGFGVYTYNEDGTTTPYTGEHNFLTVEGWVYITTNPALSNYNGVEHSISGEYDLIVDLDTGKIVYGTGGE